MRAQNAMIVVQSRTPPTIEIDTAVRAAYVRFKRADTRVARTEQIDRPRAVVTIDFDRSNEVIGIELLGVEEFSVEKLLNFARVSAPHVDLNRARYVGAGRTGRQSMAMST